MIHASPSTLAVARAVARVTFSEIMRDKILYNIVLFGLILFGVSILAARVTFISPERVILDFGMSALNISCAMIAVFTGASVLSREFERRTVYVALSHPISRTQFVFGKFLGLAGVIALNWILLSVILGFLYHLNYGVLNSTILVGVFFLFIQSLMLSGLALLISSFSTTSVAVIITIGFYLIGNNISQLRLLGVQSHSSFERHILNWVSQLLPNLEFFNLGVKVTYGIPVTAAFAFTSLLYGATVTTACLLVSGVLLKRKEE